MRSDCRRRGGRLVLAVVAVVISLPGLAQAQQTGLFPTAPVRRQRPPCDQEDPVYKIYKQQYFGYHPTCWRRFPDGWGCPSPEAPDRAKSLKEHPFGKPPDQGDDMFGPQDDPRGQPAGAPAPRPNVPQERDPFEMDGPANPPAANPATPRTRQAAPPAETRSPFDDVPGTGNPPPGRPGTNPPGAANAGAPNRGVSYRSARPQASDDEELQPVADEPPLLAMPNLNAVRDADGSGTLDPIDVAAATPVNADPNATAAPASSPAPRRSLIGSFFSNLGMNWARR
jgi:hypothetical protein